MSILLIIFASPLYFAMKSKWGAFCVNSVFYGIALLLLVTMIFAVAAPIFWFISVMHGLMDYRNQALRDHATDIAVKMAEAIRQPQASSGQIEEQADRRHGNS